MAQSYGVKAVRLTAATADILAWYEDYAEREDISLNHALLRALVAFRAQTTQQHERSARVALAYTEMRKEADRADLPSQ